ADSSLPTAASPPATGEGPAASRSVSVVARAVALLPRNAEIDAAVAVALSPVFWGTVLRVCWSGSSEPQTLSIHTTGSGVGCRGEVPAASEFAPTGEPVTLVEQPVRASAAAARAVSSAVRLGEFIRCRSRGAGGIASGTRGS